jgi:rod shape-determining protein MreD
MMGLVLSALVLAAAAVLQSTALPHLAIAGVKVDLVLLLVVAWSIRRGIEAGLVWALFGGIAIDLLSAEPLGVSVVAFGFAAILTGSVGPVLRQTSVLLPLALTPLASVVATLVAALVLALVGWPIYWPATVALVVLPAAALDSLAMVVVYPLMALVDQHISTVDWPG